MTDPRNDGVTAVALLALHDREFFEALLDDVDEALERYDDHEVVRRLTPEERQHVRRLFAKEGNVQQFKRQALEDWDRYQADGTWSPKRWPAYPPIGHGPGH